MSVLVLRHEIFEHLGHFTAPLERRSFPAIYRDPGDPGARVYSNGQLEIGWAPVYFTEAGKKDLVFNGLESPSTSFHWHGETFDLPVGAEWLAWSDKCRHQAYRYGSKVYGLQFHPEVTAEMAADWCRQEINCGDVATLEDPVDPFEQDQAGVAAQVMDRWLNLL